MTQARVIRFHRTGGPEVLELDALEVGQPGPGQVLVRQTAVGLNFIDTYQRSGLYPLPLPSGCGSEAAGVVEAVGAGVTDVSVGDRVAYGGGEPGAYADVRLVPAMRVVAIPDGVSDEAAAALLFKGMTVEYLLTRCAPLQAGQLALMYAAAGGIGLLAGQWARHLGARLIGVTTGAQKCALARDNGYFAVIDRNAEDVAARVKQISGGKGVPVVYDSIGRATYETSLGCLSPRGMLVSFGTTSGPPPPIEAATLQKHGSLYFTRPTLVTYTASRDELTASAAAVFELARRGVLKAAIGQRYPLADAARAHADLEQGRTSGASVLLP